MPKAAQANRQAIIFGPVLRVLMIGFITSMLAVFSVASISTVSAGPPINDATAPATGSGTADPFAATPVPDPETSPGYAESPKTDGGVSPNNKAYTRFEVRQTARKQLEGNLVVKGEGFGGTMPYSAKANEAFSVFTLLPELTGHYELELTLLGRNTPVLWVEGDLQRVGEGEYRHQFINGDADPDLLVLSPEDPGMIMALGSVKAKLNSCVHLFSPIDAVFTLGVDNDGDGHIGPSESVTRAIQGESSACITTPESNIPLTSLYKAQVITDQGTVVARNAGLYDFLNKSSIESEKESIAQLVREFKVQWIRTPVATSIEIMNASLRPPAVQVSVVPQVEEVTGDIIRNGSDDSLDDSAQTETSGEPPSDSGAAEEENSPGFIVKNWMWLAMGAGLVIAAFMILRGILATNTVSYRNR